MFYSSGSNIRWFAFVSWKGNSMSSQRQTIATIDYICVFAFAVHRDYHTIHHSRTCVGKTASDSHFLTKHVDFLLFLLVLAKRAALLFCHRRLISASPEISFFPQPQKKAAPLIELHRAFHAALNPG